MANESRPPILRVQQLERLDGEGAYKVAVENGLHDVILKMLRDDAKTVLIRFRGGQAYDRASYAHFIMMTLWRGECPVSLVTSITYMLACNLHYFAIKPNSCD